MEFINSILSKLANDMSTGIGLRSIVEPSLVTPTEPHLRLLPGSVILERKDNYAIREWGGKVYKATSYAAYMSLEVALQAWGNEEALKRVFFDYALRVSHYFELAKQFSITGMREWDGSFVADIKQLDNVFPDIEESDEGNGQTITLRSWAGYLVFDYYAIEAETARAKIIDFHGGP